MGQSFVLFQQLKSLNTDCWQRPHFRLPVVVLRSAGSSHAAQAWVIVRIELESCAGSGGRDVYIARIAHSLVEVADLLPLRLELTIL